MPVYLGPPPFPWVPRPANAFNPIRAWLPFDSGGQFREFVRGDHAAITGTAAWGAGSYGRCFQGNGSSYGVSGTFASTDTLSLTVAHISGSSTFRGLLGWGPTNNQGLLYSGSRLDLIDSATAMRFSANLSTPTTAWRVISLTLVGHAAGSTAEFWADGVRVSSGTINAGSGGTLSAATQFWIGAIRGGSNPWQAGLGPVYLHDRVLADPEVRKLHADLWRILRDYRDDTPRKFYSIPPPFLFSGSGSADLPAGAGSLGFSWPLLGSGLTADPAGAGSLGFTWAIAGLAESGEPVGSGTMIAGWAIGGEGVADEPSGSGVLDWPWIMAGAGLAGDPGGIGVFDWIPPPPVIPDPSRSRAVRRDGYPDPFKSRARPRI